MIKRIEIKNVRSLKDVVLDVGRMALLVGPNGSGKTTVLEAVRYCASSTTSGVDSPKGPLHRNLHTWGTNEPAVVILEGVLPTADSVPFTCNSILPHTGVPTHILRISDSNAKHSQSTPELEGLRVAYSPTRVFRLDPAAIADKTGEVKPKDVILDEAGRGVASFLINLGVLKRDREAIIQQALREVFPAIRSLGFQTEGNGYRLAFDTTHQESVPAYAMGEGVLLALSAFCVVADPNGSNLILIDEIERGLHPRAQVDFISHLRKLLEQFPEKQLIATTHSPYLVDSFDPAEVHIFGLDEKGHTRTAQLSSHPDTKRWKGVMHPGELWSAVGEEWVTKAP